VWRFWVDFPFNKTSPGLSFNKTLKKTILFFAINLCLLFYLFLHLCIQIQSLFQWFKINLQNNFKNKGEKENPSPFPGPLSSSGPSLFQPEPAILPLPSIPAAQPTIFTQPATKGYAPFSVVFLPLTKSV
jgi:hypothetical protein